MNKDLLTKHKYGIEVHIRWNWKGLPRRNTKTLSELASMILGISKLSWS